MQPTFHMIDATLRPDSIVGKGTDPLRGLTFLTFRRRFRRWTLPNRRARA